MRPPSRIVRRIAAIALTVVGGLGCAGPGELGPGGRDGAPELPFYVESYNLPSEKVDRSQLFVIVSVVYADLQWVHSKNGYHARIVTSIAVLDRDGAEILRDTSRSLRVDKFVETASKDRAERIHAVFDLVPGEYQLVVSVTDQNSLAQSVRRRQVRIRDFWRQPVAVSDILFVEHLPDTLPSPLDAIPAFRGTYPDTFYAVAQLRVQEPQIPVKVTYALSVPRGQTLLREEYTHSIPQNGDLLRVELRQADLRVGQNLFEIKVEFGEREDRATRLFLVRWSGLPQSAESLDDAIEQLRYVAPPDEWEAMRKATGEEKKRLFDAFWKRRDPTPGSPENELQEEYYTRVAEANDRFSEAARPGWQTDRGRIYIVYGPPDYITRESSERDLSTRYEIWYYQRLGQRFIFRDTGGGHYILVGVRGS